ncbi:MAG: NADH-quinone oxidoreductase subunit M, partial [Sphingomonadales bacterium]|nr:NADH-quinone oxidoreductase subunit M [Sphingomonadales bacterium]
GRAVGCRGVSPERFLAPRRAYIAARAARGARARPAGDAKVTAGKPVAAETHMSEHSEGTH